MIRHEAGHGRDTEMTVVHTANGEMEALALKSVLEAAGIPVELDMESATKLFVVTVDGLGAVRIRVPADRAEEARAVLATPAEPIGDEGW
jgi:ribosomal protein L12E/L44/L45/RPP1/RPP2